MATTPLFFIVKVALSGILIAAVSSLAKTYPKWAALLTALPLMTILSVIWIYIETRDKMLLSHYVRDVFIWVLPGLIFFAAATYLFKTKLPFVVSFGLSVGILAAGIWAFEKLNLLK